MKKHQQKEGMKKNRKDNEEPTVAPSMEMDELEVDASKEDIKGGNYTSVTKLFVDRVD